MKNINNFILFQYNKFICTDTEVDSAVDPIFSFLNVFGPVLIGMLVAVGAIYCTVLGVQYSRAETSDERKNAKSKMVNAIWGFVTIIILISILYGLKVPIVNALK